MRLSSLNPFALLLGPVFQKEVRSAGRRRATYVFRALYAAALLGLVAIAYYGVRDMTRFTSGVQRLQMLQELAPGLALVLMWFQFIALALAAPIFTGAAICDERRARTLATLLTTPLTAAQIVWGKLSSRVVQVAILALLAAPLLLAIRVFGGLDAGLIVSATAVSLSTVFLGAALALLFSTWNRRATNAAVFGLLSLILVQAAPVAVEWIIVMVTEQEARGRGEDGEYQFHPNVLATCSPAVMALTSRSVIAGFPEPVVEIQPAPPPPGQAQTAASVVIAPMWVVNSLYNLVMGAGAALCATVALRRAMRREGASEGSTVAAAPRRARPKPGEPPPALAPAEPAIESDPAPAAPLAPAEDADDGRDAREVSDRPVLWREVRQATFGSRQKLLLVIALAGAGLLYLYYQWGMDEEGVHATLAVIGGIAVMVQPVFMTTGSIAGEREARTWEVLLATPLSARAILLGKAAGALRAQWLLPAIVMAHFALAVILGYARPILLVHLALIYLSPILLFTATGQLYSLVFRKGVTAAACNLFTALMLWGGAWVVLAVLASFTEAGGTDWFDRAADCLLAVNPVATAVWGCEPGIRGRGGFGMLYHFGVEGTPVSAGRFTAIVLGVFLGHVGAAAAVMGAALVNFRKLSGRSS